MQDCVIENPFPRGTISVSRWAWVVVNHHPRYAQNIKHRQCRQYAQHPRHSVRLAARFVAHAKRLELCGSLVTQKCDHFVKAPDVIGHASIHRRGDAKALVDAHEVVNHVVQRDGVLMVLELL
jgi:hypothetical protein